jgi:hypothetical protein
MVHRAFLALGHDARLLLRILDNMPSRHLRHLGHHDKPWFHRITRDVRPEESTSPAKRAVPERFKHGASRRRIKERGRVFRRRLLHCFVSCRKRHERRRREEGLVCGKVDVVFLGEEVLCDIVGHLAPVTELVTIMIEKTYYSLGPKRTLAILDEILAHSHTIMDTHEPPPLVLPRSRLLLLLGHLLSPIRITIIHTLSLVPALLFIIPTVLDVFRRAGGHMVGLAFRRVVVDHGRRDTGRDDVPIQQLADSSILRKKLTLL